MDIKLIREYVNLSSSNLEVLKEMLDYRNLRTEQAYYSRLAYEYDKLMPNQQCKIVRNAGEMMRSHWRGRSYTLDKERRAVHNTALTGFCRMIEMGRKASLESIFDGKVLTEKEITSHVFPRDDLTDSMFEVLNVIEEAVISDEKQKEDEIYVDFKGLQKDMEKFNREYDVKKSIVHDESALEDGGIEFDLSALFENNDNNTSV